MTQNQMIERLETAAEDLRQILLEIDNMLPIPDDWQERQRIHAIEGIREAKNKLGFVNGYIRSLQPTFFGSDDSGNGGDRPS